MTQAVNLANFANSLNSSGQMDPAALSSAVSVSKGGTGASSFTSGSIIKGNGTSALSSASAADIVSAIGATAVTNATNATNATKLVTASWTVEESGGQLLFKYGGVTKFTMDQTNGFSAA